MSVCACVLVCDMSLLALDRVTPVFVNIFLSCTTCASAVMLFTNVISR